MTTLAGLVFALDEIEKFKVKSKCKEGLQTHNCWSRSRINNSVKLP